MNDDSQLRRVLLVDDDRVDRQRLTGLLAERGYDIEQADSGAKALHLLAQPGAPRIAIVDWTMSTIDGPNLCRILRERSPYTYVVLTTAREGRRPLIEAMHSGADGYVQKPTDADELEAWVVAGQRIVDLQDRLLEAQAELRRLATHDELTAVRNRRAILEELERELQRASRIDSPTCVILFDIDHFKRVNDEHGHTVGDEVLMQFASRCAQTARSYDVFGRYGGEEFLFFAPSEGMQTAGRITQRLMQAVTSKPFVTSAGPLKVHASAGVATTDLGYETVRALIRAADEALYTAKRAGRGCFRFAERRKIEEDQGAPSARLRR